MKDLEKKRALNIPQELRKDKYLKRTLSQPGTTMKQFRDIVFNKNIISLPIFIKPDRYSKEFIAGIFEPHFSLDVFKNIEIVLIDDAIDSEDHLYKED